jgi:adenylate kinase family enzyme
MKRVMVIGPGGAGKSTFSRELAERLGLPVVHLDAEYWRSGWQPTEKEEWRARMDDLTAAPAWIIDGNYGGTMDIRLERCDTVVFLDLPRAVCLWRVLKRQITFRGRSRPDMAPGCPERLTFEFVQWIWTYPERRRPAILQSLRTLAPHQQGFVLSSRRDVRRFLDDIASARAR